MSDPYVTHPGHPLFGGELKMRRAEEHFQALDAAITTFIRGDAYAPINEFENKSGHNVVRLMVRRETPPEWSPLIGDIVHNGRSTLDHLAWQLVKRNRKRPTGSTAFPIFLKDPFDPGVYDSAIAAEDALKRWKRQTKGMSTKDVAFIKRLQPYAGTENPNEHPLARLNQLSNWDKHRELHLAAQVFTVTGLKVFDDTRDVHIRLLRVAPLDNMVEDGAEMARHEVFFTGDDPNVNVKLQASFDVVFGKGSPLEGLRVVETLMAIGGYISDIMDECKERFDGQA